MSTPSPPAPGRSWITLLLAACAFGMFVVAMVFLTAGYFAPVVLAAGVLFGTFGCHYVVWGRWLSQRLQAESRRDEPPAAPPSDEG